MTEPNVTSYYPNLRQSWGIVGMGLLFVLLFIPLQILLDNLAGQDMSFFVSYVCPMGAAFWYAHSKRIVPRYTVDKISFKAVILVAVAAVAIQFGIISPLVSLIPMPEFIQDMILELTRQSGFFTFLSVVIAAPVLEELVFRGIILDGLLTRYSPLKSILLSSMLFGVFHLNPWQFITAFILGLFSGWVYYETRSLTLSIVIHFVNNLLAYGLLYFIDIEKSIHQSLPEQYGGYLNFFIITFGAIAVAVISLYRLRHDLKNARVSTPPTV